MAKIVARQSTLDEVEFFRDMYRLEMRCQIIHDSIHRRSGWTQEYLLLMDSIPIGYGSLAVGGPWATAVSIFEFYLTPPARTKIFESFDVLVLACGAKRIETQSNDRLLTNMLLTFCNEIRSEAILFHDVFTTQNSLPGVTFREKQESDSSQIAIHELDDEANWVLEYQGGVVAAGDILYHYNRPYGDIYMKVGQPFRQLGFGSFLVQELKRVCYARGSIPAARCNVNNEASRATLQKAGFVPCGHIFYGLVQNQAKA